MKTAAFAPAIIVATLMTLSACSQDRKAEADTGTAEVTIKTEAPASQVPDSQLQRQAEQAAAAASTPVDGSGPITTTAPSMPPATQEKK